MLKHFLIFQILIYLVYGGDITNSVFSSITDGLPVAFGDFNSDELTDVFVLRDNQHTVEVLLGSEEEPLLHSKNIKCSFSDDTFITSIAPGDFDGDAFMDILITITKEKNRDKSFVVIGWGSLDDLDCPKSDLLIMKGQPLVLDVNFDMIIDLVGLDEYNNRSFWIFNNNRTSKPTKVPFSDLTNVNEIIAQKKKLPPLTTPHSHAIIDLNNDFIADLFLTTEEGFEIWNGNTTENYKFTYNRTIQKPSAAVVGQVNFLDMELIDRIDIIVPVCFDAKCYRCAILVNTGDTWQDLRIDFKDLKNHDWGYILPNPLEIYQDAITLRSGDYNMDGYPDLLVSLQNKFDNSQINSFFLENVECETTNCGKFNRTFSLNWKLLYPFNNNSVMAVFHDFYQDGILDLIFVHKNSMSALQPYSVTAYKNSLDYDANFIKVMVLTGLTNSKNVTIPGHLGKKKRTFGTNLPGPTIRYRTTTQEDIKQLSVAAQLPQSAYNSLIQPYVIFGLGRTPNFIDSLVVGLAGRNHEWTQIIPNSQMVVIPKPLEQSNSWKAQLFVTPSKIILNSALALTGVCGLITMIILLLYWKERQEDKKERLQESHRFHFDAM